MARRPSRTEPVALPEPYGSLLAIDTNAVLKIAGEAIEKAARGIAAHLDGRVSRNELVGLIADHLGERLDPALVDEVTKGLVTTIVVATAYKAVAMREAGPPTSEN